MTFGFQIGNRQSPIANRQSRPGITILEVLISIGVATIGIFGVMAMLPLGSYFAAKGLTEDNKSAVGKSAYREFHIRGMGEVENWVNSDGSAAFQPIVNNPAIPAEYYKYYEGFCIDPRFVARNGNVDVAAGKASRFPYANSAPVATTMRRFTLRIQPVFNATNPYPGGAPLSAMLADQIFQTGDDLIFNPDPDNSNPPLQEYVLSAPADPTSRVKRQSHGNISWMATLAPKLASQGRDLYTLSIVVFHKREFDMNPPLPDLPGERVAAIPVANFYGGGVAGGDVELVANLESDVEAKVGNWIMLSQSTVVPGPDGVTPVPAPVFKWYRVIAADPDADNSSGMWTRNVTLDGPDWNNTIATQATIVPSVIGVFEKTIRRESSGLWTQIDK